MSAPLRHFVWPEALLSGLGLAGVVLLVGTAIFGFTQGVFGVIERMQGEITRQNQ